MSLAVSLVICGAASAVVLGFGLGVLGIAMGLSSRDREKRALVPLMAGAFLVMIGIVGLALLYGGL